MGVTGSGKSTVRSVFSNNDKKFTRIPQFINLASGSSLPIAKESQSCTSVELANVFTLDGRRVILIDIPGFDDATENDMDILKLIGTFLATS